MGAAFARARELGIDFAPTTRAALASDMGNDETVFRFGGFELQPGERRLLRSGRSLPVGPRAFDVLVALVERSGRLVTKDELLERVWPKLVVEENNLQVQVSALRKILGATAIATVPGRGYRFTLELESAPAVLTVPTAAPPHHVPDQVTSFIGRDHELASVRKLLGKSRLLTLVGVGGIGKTRLALQVAADLIGVYPGGMWFVDLAPLADPRLVPQAVASALGVNAEPGCTLVDALVKFVKDRQLLLILDNCEHLDLACAELSRQLLRSGPHVTILATSRELLHVAGETIYSVPPLVVPDQHTADVPTVMCCEAVQLFADRAVASQPAFHVTAHNATAIVDICRRLDGIPLALELAAARVRALSVEKIAERLGDRFRLLTRGDQTALPRQQTLRTCIDWSYDLLTEHERALLRRLSVFAGGWTLEACEAVVAGGEVAVSDVLDLLTRLVEKSLVALEANGERYRLLETVQKYAEERLNGSGECDEVRARHAKVFLALAENTRQYLTGPDQRTWFARLALERENLLAAHAWCGRMEGEAEHGLMLVDAMKEYWIHRGGLELGYLVTTEALMRASAQERGPTRAKAMYSAAVLASSMGSYIEAQGWLEECLSIAREIGDDQQTATALVSLGDQFQYQRKAAEARRHTEEALSIARRLGRKKLLSIILTALAEIERLDGAFEKVEPLYREGLALARELGDLRTIAINLINLARESIRGGDRKHSADLLLEALALVERTGSRPLGAYVILISTGLAAFHGEPERAARLFGASTRQFTQIGLRPDPLDESFLSPLVAKARERLGTTAFLAAEAAGCALAYEDAITEARAWLSDASQSKRSRLRAVR